ncbi:gamma-glutamyltransferase [Pseudactinotalea sp. Z1739]|uniref:gamma-glutamyltransferase n=1 Tax=Pseudactinotalea sp. Z1739 TaxID=3413028 RepID=UPI003C79F3E0
MSRQLTITVAAAALLLAGCSEAPEDDVQPTPTTEQPAPTDTDEPTDEPSEPTQEPEPEPEPESPLAQYGISAAHPLAAAAGEEIFDAGGNAADAIVAAAFAVSVVEPFASGIGGGGSAIVVPAEGEAQAYDYREVVPNSGTIGAGGAGVPGFVAGLGHLHEEYGELEWDQVLAPAIDLARDGFEVSPFLALRMRSDYGPEAISGLEHYAPGGQPLDQGDLLVQANLATTMSTIAQEGPDAYYTGSLAQDLSVVDGLDAQSLADYEVVTSSPVRGEFAGYEVLGPAPPLPGVSLIQMLQIAEAGGLDGTEPGSAAFIELIGRGWESGYETTTTVLGDPAFVDVPVDELTNAQANAGLAGGTVQPPTFGPPDPGTAGNTTHLTVVDPDGLLISMTNTITSFWGSQQHVGGYFLNNQLTRFDAIGTTAANQPEAGRRSVSWSLPAVVVDAEGRAVLGIGTPGAERIPQVLAQVISRWAVHDQTLTAATEAPRFSYEDGQLLLEAEPSAGFAQGVSGSYEVVPPEWAYFGSLQALEVDYDTGEVTGPVDERREAAVVIGAP